MKTFEITGYGKDYGDQTREYIIKVNPDNTVRDVIQDILSNQNEWGYIELKLSDWRESSKNRLEYGKGVIINLDKVTYWRDKLDKKVINMKGNGGWSRSDYQLEIE